ncbi:saccharopine dehydrogenase NADP-binding domain-containing protein [Oceanobacillus sp. 1P07AA]|uniref:saccharopine dehydrogenase NADP-binding domain-containing protein n=1 Tax=Oceanobacillus sp. 1P07AA TaxID=3132293 RepID=UPI0039A64A75
MVKIMVVGASGSLGQLICKEIIRIFDKPFELIVTDYKETRGELFASSLEHKYTFFKKLDINNEEEIHKTIVNLDLVIVAIEQKHPMVQEKCIEKQIMCIDVTPYQPFVDMVLMLNSKCENNQVASIVMSGFLPGLSGLMIKEGIRGFQEVEEVNLGFLQSTNAKVGVTGIVDMLSIVSDPVDLNNQIIKGFSFKKRMEFYKKDKQSNVRLIHHAEQKHLKENLKINNLRYWTAWDQPIFNKAISLFNKTGFINFITQARYKHTLSKFVKHNPRKSENAYLTVEIKGKSNNVKHSKLLQLVTPSDYYTTAMITAALSNILLKHNLSGARFPFQITNLDNILRTIKSDKIQLNIRDK